MQGIRLNKQTKTIRIVNRETTLRLDKQTNTMKVVNRPANLRLQHSGKTGPAGPQGPQGLGIPTGGTPGQMLSKESETDYDLKWLTPLFSDKTFVHNFTVASTVTVNHNLEKFPAVTVKDSSGQEVVGDVVHIDTNSLTAYFTAPFSGQIICN